MTNEAISEGGETVVHPSDAKPYLVTVDLSLAATANAQQYHEEIRGAREKASRIRQSEKQAFASAKSRMERAMKEGEVKARVKRNRKRNWFERYRWFISSDGYLILAGHDAQENEFLVKRHASKYDVFVHAELHGAAAVIIKVDRAQQQPDDAAGLPVPARTLNEAATFAVCFSSAWETHVTVPAYWVRMSQVSKAAPTGEYVPTGAFVIRGNKNFLTPPTMILGIAVVFKLEPSCVEAHRADRLPKWGGGNADEGISSTGAALEQGAAPVSSSEVPCDATFKNAYQNGAIGGELPPRVDDTSSADARSQERCDRLGEEGGGHTTQQDSAVRSSSSDGGSEEQDISQVYYEEIAAKLEASDLLELTASDHDVDNDGDSDNDSDSDSDSDSESDSDNESDNDDHPLILSQEPPPPAPVPDRLEAGVTSEHASSKVIASMAREGQKGPARAAVSFAVAAGPSDEGLERGSLRTAAQRKESEDKKMEVKKSGRERAKGPKRVSKAEEMPNKEKNTTGTMVTGKENREQIASSCVPNECLKRGQKSRLRKKIHRYKDQDENERALAMEVLHVSLKAESSSKLKKKAKAFKAQQKIQRASAAAALRAARQLQGAAVAAVTAEDVEASDPEEDERHESDFLFSFTGIPTGEDQLLYALLVCAPYSTLRDYKFKVKLTPGNVKRGRAVKLSLGLFGCAKEASPHQRELVRSLKDQDNTPNMPSLVKVSAPNMLLRRAKGTSGGRGGG